MKYCFDIDGTLCTNTYGKYEDALPISSMIRQVNFLYQKGHTIILFTARGSTTGIDWRELTERQMKTWGVLYHQLILGKPEADFYIDDKAVSLSAWQANPPEMEDKSFTVKFGKPLDMRSLGRTIDWRMKTRNKMIEAAKKAHIAGKRTACPICNGHDLKPYVCIYGFNYVVCVICGHLFYEQVVKDEDIADIYSGDSTYLDMHVNNNKSNYIKRTELIAKPKMEFISSLIGKASQGNEWLDIACGGCQLLYAAKLAGWNVRGIEAGKLGVVMGEELGIPVENHFVTTENIPELLGNPDIVSMIEFLEHLANPVTFLTSLSLYLKPRTYVAIGVPRHPSMSSFATFLFPDLATRHLIVPDHIHIFSDESLAVMMKKAGLEIIGVWKYGQDFYELMSMMTMRAGREIDIWPDGLHNAINEVQEVLDRHNLSDGVLAVGRKL